ncbi:MAG: HAD family phosphatase [Clostridia bacterium]|nr:HAD family phosphatase [Clostridia bacterium]
MQYRLLAMDLDGTLTDSRKKISEHARDCLERAARRGVTLALASGRPLIGIQKVAEALDLERLGGYIMAFNGGQIIDCATGREIYRKDFPLEYMGEAVEWARREHLAILSYDNEGIVTEGPVDQYVLHESGNNGIPIKQVSSLTEYMRFPFVKMLICGEPSHLLELKDRMAAAFAGRLDIYLAEPVFLEVMPLGIDKAAGLERLMRHLSLDARQVIACGDAYNDIPMMRLAYASVAVSNAVQEVREISRFITRSNDEDGVAYAVERLVLSDMPHPERGVL